MATLPVSKNESLLEEWRKTLNDEFVRSPFRPVEIPRETLVSRTLRALKEHAKAHPDKPAVIDAFNQKRFFTYQQIHDHALSISSFLQSRGFEEGNRAITVLPNCIEFPLIHLGVWSAGGVFVGCSPTFKHHETVYQLRDSASSVVFTNETLLKSVLEAVEECPEVKVVVCIRHSSSPLPEGVIDFQDVLCFLPINAITSVATSSPCLVFYSSGTTGQPKGVIHTHDTFHYTVEVMRSYFHHEVYPVLGVNKVDWNQECHIISTGCFHLLGFGLLNMCLLTGSPTVIMERLDEVLYPELVAQFKPRCLFVSPPIFSYLAKHPIGRAAPLESVQMIRCGTAPLSAQVSNEFLAAHPNVKYVVQGYGMTEVGCSNYTPLFKEGVNASCGVVASGYEQKIVVPGTRQTCKRGEQGEICTRGPGVAIGYLNKPEATKALFDDDGWLHTGDIGYIDEFGSLYVIERLKELIKVNYANQALQVPPAELEGVLLSHPSIRDVAIVGIPHEAGGELVRAFVVKAEDGLKAEDVERIIEENLALYKRITGGVVFVKAIPRSATGKILRRELREYQYQ